MGRLEVYGSCQEVNWRYMEMLRVDRKYVGVVKV